MKTVLVTSLELWTATGEDPVDAWADASIKIATQALDRLDGSDTTQLWLESDAARLGVAGGPDRFFVGYAESIGATYEARDPGSDGEVRNHHWRPAHVVARGTSGLPCGRP